MSDVPVVQTRLPENAYRELAPGEIYTPMVPAGVIVPEVTRRSIIFGIVMNVIFSMAATYLALKVGQGIETAIPISILAVGFSGAMLRAGKRASSLLENVNILAISTTSGIVAGGTVFTMPAIYILNLNEKLQMGTPKLFFIIFLVPLLGAILGALLLVPFRRYFVKEMHGKLPFPEGTATNEILVAGASGGNQASVLIYSFVIGMLYNWVSGAMKLFTETFSTAEIPALGRFTDKVKAVFSLGTGAEFVGLGYIIGIRYASIILAGSFLSWFVIIPVLSPLSYQQVRLLSSEAEAHAGEPEEQAKFSFPSGVGARLDELKNEKLSAAEKLKLRNGLSAEMIQAFAKAGEPLNRDDPRFTVVESGKRWKIRGDRRSYILRVAEDKPEIKVFGLYPGAEDLFRALPRSIGIGCIFTAGLLSILKMGKVIVTALRQALGGLFRSATVTAIRTDEDISYPALLLVGLGVSAAIWAYFRLGVLSGMENVGQLSIIALVLALFVAFIFTTVSAWAIAMISVTPISGMTVTTIIITAVVLLACHLPRNDAGMLAVLLVGGVVASALSMAGTLITEFKIGYWIGATPRKIQWSAIIASVLASAAVTATIMVLAVTPGYDASSNTDALQAPQANLMASALRSFVGTGDVPWTIYGAGAVVALLVQMLGVSPLAFGLGMYLPMELNAPLLVGAIIAWMVENSSKDTALSKARNDRGILIASGLIAGAAIIGVVKSLLKLMSDRVTGALDLSRLLPSEAFSNWLGLGAFMLLCLLVYLDCLRAKPAREQLS
jgi:uncharacterized oligopeptide transporter (OPT) family protein